MAILRHFTEHSRGIRCGGAAATNLCHLASGERPSSPRAPCSAAWRHAATGPRPAATRLCAPAPRAGVAAGVVDAYYQFELKPWDVTAGIVILEEAGGRVSTADGLAYSVFDRSLLATNDALYDKVRVTRPDPNP